MANLERKWMTLFAVLFLFGVGLLYLMTKPAHAEGSTFTNVLRQAGKRGVFITLSSSVVGESNTGWVTITDLTDSYVCAKGQRLICVPTDKISSVTIDGVDSLPSGGQ